MSIHPRKKHTISHSFTHIFLGEYPVKKSIVTALQETIQQEQTRTSRTNDRIETLTKRLERLGYNHKPEYSLPLIDTVGRSISDELQYCYTIDT